jgi:hypothetical protein
MAAVLLMVGRGLEQPSVVQRMLNVAATPQKPQYNMAPEVRGLLSAACLVDKPHGAVSLGQASQQSWVFRHASPALPFLGLS